MARLQREPRIAIIVLSDLIVPSRHSVLPGPWPQIAAHRNILACFTPAVFHFATYARHGECPIIGRTCQRRRPAQWLRPMTCAKLIVGSEGLVGKFRRPREALIIEFLGVRRRGLDYWRRGRFLWCAFAAARAVPVAVAFASGASGSCGGAAFASGASGSCGGAAFASGASGSCGGAAFASGASGSCGGAAFAAAPRAAFASGAARFAAQGRGLQSHPLSDIMIEVGR